MALYSQKILIIDDDVDNLRLVAKTLSHDGYKVETANSGEEGIQKLSLMTPDLVILDRNMPGMSGVDTLTHLRNRDLYVSVIFLTAQGSTESIIQGLDAGADDYVCKPFNVMELAARVRSQLRIKDLHDQLKAANRRLQELVDIDDLTGLYNMRSIYEKLDYELDRAKRYNTSLAVVMMDMDNFKHVNDGHDHLFGSFVLSEVGKIIKDNIRSVDFAARYGGDEFLVVLNHTKGDGAKKFAERLREKIYHYDFRNGPDEVRLTASLGLAFVEDGKVGQDARGLVRLADNALYGAKNEGKNRVICVHASGETWDPRLIRKHGA